MENKKEKSKSKSIPKIKKKLIDPAREYLSKMLNRFSFYKKIKSNLSPYFTKYRELYLKNKYRLKKTLLLFTGLVFFLFVSVSIYQAIGKLQFRVNPPGITNVDNGEKPEPLFIYFEKPVASLDQLDRPILEGITINPNIAGQWRWTNDRELVFFPEEDWGIGEKYHIYMDKTIFSRQMKIRSQRASFKTPSFNGNIISSSLYQDPRDPRIIRITSSVKFTHPVNQEEFKKACSINIGQSTLGFGGKELGLKIDFNSTGTEAYIASEPITIKIEKQEASIEIDSSLHASRGSNALKQKLKDSVDIPDMETFFHIEHSEIALIPNEAYVTEQILIIETTAGISTEELMEKIKVVLLPTDRYLGGDLEPERNFAWFDPGQITDASMKNSTKVQLKPLSTPEEFPRLHSYKITVPVNRYLYLNIPAGVKSLGDFTLVNAYKKVIAVPVFPKEVKIAQSGSILSLKGEKKLTIYSRDVEAIKYTIKKIKHTDIPHLVTQGLRYNKMQTPEFDSYGTISEDNIAKTFTKITLLQKEPPGVTQFSSLDLGSFLKDHQVSYGLFILEAESYNPATKQTTGNKDRRFIMLTDLGIVSKKNRDESHDIFIQSISSGRPAGNVKVQILGKNGLATRTDTTDNQGHAFMDSVKGLYREQYPEVILASRGDDLAFLPYNLYSRSVQYSRFDVGGEYTSENKKNLDAYLFSDRGIYRPGDEIRMGIIVKTSDWRSLNGIPLELSILDPRGVEIHKQILRFKDEGFEEIKHQSGYTSPTGEYNFRLYLLKDDKREIMIGNESVRLEEFVPDKMKIKSKITPERTKGWISPEQIRAHVTLTNLFGTPAADHRITASVRFSPAMPYFREYSAYRFYDPLKSEGSFNERLEDVTTNDEGEATIPINFKYLQKATYRLDFYGNGHAMEGGRAVRTTSSVIVSPLEYLIGYKPDGDFSYIKKNMEHSFHLIAISPEVKKVAVKGLSIELYQEKPVSALMRGPNGLYSYQTVEKKVLISKTSLPVSIEGKTIALKTDEPGDFIYIVKNSEGLELSTVRYTVAGAGNLTARMDKDAELQIKLNKDDVSAGEEVEIYIKAPYAGAGVITIEREKVYAYKWFKTNTASSVQSIRIPGDIEGNAYINVTFLRDIDSHEIFMSPLSYAVAPFAINQKARSNEVTLVTPDIVRPGQVMNISYKTSRPGKIVIFAVDQGILQVARYQKPDPLGYFFRKKALQVSTSQILDLILPEFSLLKKLSQPGGGDEMDRAGLAGANLNPFQAKQNKPVAYWSGILESDGEMRSVQYQVPDYFNGTIKVMAVAVSENSIGTGSEKSLSRGHFVISPNAPYFTAPGDRFTAGIAISNNVENSGKNPEVTITLDYDKKYLKLSGNAQQKIVIPEGKEKPVTFEFESLPKFGPTEVTVTASYKNFRSVYRFSMSIRPPVPYLTFTQSGTKEKGKETIPLKKSLYPEYAKKQLIVSYAPIGYALGLSHYLSDYPYGCTEQLVSKSVPALLFYDHPELGFNNQTVEKNLKVLIKTLSERQTSEGSFGFWSPASYVDRFQTTYATHFLTDLEETGYNVPYNLKSKALKYLSMITGRPAYNLYDARIKAYAIYVLTRNGILSSNALLTLHEQLNRDEIKGWKKDPAAAYMAASYMLMQKKKEAENLIGQVDIGGSIFSNYINYHDQLSRDAQLLYILAKHFPDWLSSVTPRDMKKILKPVTQGQYNTLSSAFTILALNAYTEKAKSSAISGFKFFETVNKNETEIQVEKNRLFFLANAHTNATSITVDPESSNEYFYQSIEAGFPATIPEKELSKGLEINREIRDRDGNTITSGVLGDEVEVIIYIRSLSDANLSNIAITDLLPGGFEVMLDSLSNARPVASRDNSYDDGYETFSYVQSGFPLYTDIREDRLLFFGEAQKTVQQVRYRARLVAPGNYILPPLYGESMYDRTVYAVTEVEEFIIQKPDK